VLSDGGLLYGQFDTARFWYVHDASGLPSQSQRQLTNMDTAIQAKTTTTTMETTTSSTSGGPLFDCRGARRLLQGTASDVAVSVNAASAWTSP